MSGADLRAQFVAQLAGGLRAVAAGMSTTTTVIAWVLVISGFLTGLWLVVSWARQPDDVSPPNGDHDRL
ncbi:hypothetical protein ACIA49_38860 [Kribbella sp. NPDC051587]|uniref:hypothetical protein n=1 Tax=Kribbella sp. NPDC051587 TaxID=3364119 RepID=UPI0037BBE8A0